MGRSCLVSFITTRKVPSGSGRCNLAASAHGAVIQASISVGVVRITGMAFGGIRPTVAFGSVVRKPKSKCSPVTWAAFVPRVPVHGVQIPAKAKSGRLSSRAN